MGADRPGTLSSRAVKHAKMGVLRPAVGFMGPPGIFLLDASNRSNVAAGPRDSALQAPHETRRRYGRGGLRPLTPAAHCSRISTTIFPICFPSLSRSTAAIPCSNGNVESTLARSFPSPRRRMISAYSVALPMVEPMMVY